MEISHLLTQIVGLDFARMSLVIVGVALVVVAMALYVVALAVRHRGPR